MRREIEIAEIWWHDERAERTNISEKERKQNFRISMIKRKCRGSEDSVVRGVEMMTRHSLQKAHRQNAQTEVWGFISIQQMAQ